MELIAHTYESTQCAREVLNVRQEGTPFLLSKNVKDSLAQSGHTVQYFVLSHIKPCRPQEAVPSPQGLNLTFSPVGEGRRTPRRESKKAVSIHGGGAFARDI